MKFRDVFALWCLVACLNVKGLHIDQNLCRESLLKVQDGPGNERISDDCVRYWATVLDEYHRAPSNMACIKVGGQLPQIWPEEDKCGLAKWFRASGGIINHVEVALIDGQTVDGSPAKIRGLVATRDIRAGDGIIIRELTTPSCRWIPH